MKKMKDDGFAKDKIAGEYEKPGPRMDSDASAIAAGLTKLKKRDKTGVVLNWLPPWARKANIPPFSFYFFEDGLVVDTFGRDQDEMDALADDLNQSQRQEVSQKTVLCPQNGLKYLHLGPDDELDMTQLAAKLGKTNFKKGARQERPKAKVSGDGIDEEECL